MQSNTVLWCPVPRDYMPCESPGEVCLDERAGLQGGVRRQDGAPRVVGGPGHPAGPREGSGLERLIPGAGCAHRASFGSCGVGRGPQRGDTPY